jgi:hypothetical protein
MVTFVTRGGIYEKTELNSPTYRILKSDPQFKEIKPPKVRVKPTPKINKAIFVTSCGYYEEVDKNSPAYNILKKDPQFKEITKHCAEYNFISNVSTELCVLNTTKTNNKSAFKTTQKWVHNRFNSVYSSKDYVIVLGYNTGVSIFEFKKKYPNRKVIVYQLEQLFNCLSGWYDSNSTNSLIKKRTNHVKEWLDNADEIWDYDLDNIEFLNSLGYKVKYVPLSIDNTLKYNKEKNIKKEYDLIFYGALNEKRYTWLKKFDTNYKLLVIGNDQRGKFRFKNIIPEITGEGLFKHVFNAHIAINLHYYDAKLQEQVRIFELLSNDVCVISEKSRRNYLNVPEFETFEEACALIDHHLKKKKTPLKKKRVVYTCISGDYDQIKEIKIKNPLIDYVCFTDNVNVKSNTWEIRKIPEWVSLLLKKEPLKIQRFIKLMPHLFFEKWDSSIYLDGSMRITKDIHDMFEVFEKHDFVVPFHPKRKCIYDEGTVVIEKKLDLESVVKRQMDYYKKDGFISNQGLIQSGFIYRKHNRIESFSLDWWKQVYMFSHRDQLSFNYAIQNHDFDIQFIDPNIISSEFISYYLHISNKPTKLNYKTFSNLHKGKPISNYYDFFLNSKKV